MTIETVLTGATYEGQTQEHTFYLTINHDADGKVCELFMRLDDKDQFEMVQLVTRLASMALKAGVNPSTVAGELKNVYSPVTQHIIPGTDVMCPSIVARIGFMLEEHINGIK